MVYEDIEYSVSNNNVHVCNSYLVNDDRTKDVFISHLLETVEGLKEHRSKKSLIDEWKAHNALYQRGKFVSHTKEVDFEFKQKWYYAVAYWIVARLLKEKL